MLGARQDLPGPVRLLKEIRKRIGDRLMLRCGDQQLDLVRRRGLKHRVAPGDDWGGIIPGSLLHALAEHLIEGRAITNRLAENPGHFRGGVRALPSDWIVDQVRVAERQRPFTAAQPGVATPHARRNPTLEQIQRPGQPEIGWCRRAHRSRAHIAGAASA